MPPFRTADGRLLPPRPVPSPRSSSAGVARASFCTRLLGSLTTSDVLQWGSTKKHEYTAETASPSGRRSPERRKRRMDSFSSSEDDGEEEDDSDQDNGGEIRTEITGGHYQIAVGSGIQEVAVLVPVQKARKDRSPAAAIPSSDDSGEARGGPSPPPQSSTPWNLRKRRSLGVLQAAQRQHTQPQPQPPLDAAANNHWATPRAKKECGTEKKGKTMLQLTLTKEEIYDDFFLMIGAPPPRKYKKRPAKTQRYIERLNPEPSALRITADLYRVPEEKGQRR